MKVLLGTAMIGNEDTRLVDTIVPEVVPLTLNFQGDNIIGRAECIPQDGNIAVRCHVDDDEIAETIANPLVCTLAIDGDPIPVVIGKDMSQTGQDEFFLLGGRVTLATVLSSDMADLVFQE